MSVTSGMKLRVTTEELEAAASETDTQVKNMRQKFEEIDRIVQGSSSYWEAEGQEAYVSAYRAKADQIEEALRRFSENADDLRTMAGIYESTEAAAVEEAGLLSEDVIV